MVKYKIHWLGISAEANSSLCRQKAKEAQMEDLFEDLSRKVLLNAAPQLPLYDKLTATATWRLFA